MRTLLFLLLTVSLAASQNIETRTLNPKVPMRVVLSPNVATTILLPEAPSGTFGLGLASAQNPNGAVQLDHPDGSQVLILRALNESARVVLTVLMSGTLYVFDVQAGPNPDIALTFTKTDQSALKAELVTPEQVVTARPKYDPELLVGLLRRARDSAILQPLYKDLYAGYSKRDAQYTSDSGSVKTTVTTIHRFSKEDALVLQGVVENETDKPITFDGRAATVQVANEMHPIKLLDCLRPIPAHTKTLIDVVIQGDIDGSRANLSADNEFRIILPGDTGSVWSLKNGVRPTSGFKVPAPQTPTAIPLTQTGKPKKEVQ
jgi:hypothetical protein